MSAALFMYGLHPFLGYLESGCEKGRPATHLSHLVLAYDLRRYEDGHIMLPLSKHIISRDQELDVSYLKTRLFQAFSGSSLSKRFTILEMAAWALKCS